MRGGRGLASERGGRSHCTTRGTAKGTGSGGDAAGRPNTATGVDIGTCVGDDEASGESEEGVGAAREGTRKEDW